ncbi:BTAD domain-containing putative transcriptional regulator [Amycolatopsis roodepoortensis]|uniref:DNA-binding SARP family transcriptional activator n=1 Tax=Amycolatopsis roodepoortensis TaxID=700274 RepID=A0ABR9LAS1_9PSEU|nr:BTAD domain-containing putative transcriptional regulator [Amycolatopsis roodepoortensis]MBE1577779.1 DNA-binding SARP family transcriptional activator [Amycolatopsis roodepoortensis]
MARVLRIRVLGPFEVETAEGPVDVGGRQRALLASLAFSANQVVPQWKLIDHVWGEESPLDVRNGLQTLVSRLRRSLGADAVETTEGGYLLRADAAELDLLALRELVDSAAAAARAGDTGREYALLEAAVRLWRGDPLEDVASPGLRAEAGPKVAELWFAARERMLDVDLERGDGQEVIADLLDLTARHPLRESLWARLMLALHRAGRRADALDAYRRVSELVREQLGLDVGRAVADLHQAILRDDEALVAEQPAAAQVPRQLPGDVRGFVGRGDELAGLDRLVSGADGQPVVISAVDGAAGIGKTTLAVHWAHQVATRFPDGQLYLNLRGYGPSAPVDPADALDVLLRSLGVPPERVPADLEERAALWRTESAVRRVLVVLDNVRDSAQVRPLLPGGGSVVVTSRRKLRGLTAREGARHVTLGLLSPVEGLELFTDQVGQERVAAEPDAAAAIVELCARLPLALRLAADHAARHPEWPLSALRDELAGQHGLDVLSVDDDRDTDLRSLFDWSYDVLDSQATAVFDVLGLFPGDTIGEHAVAALAAIPPAEAGAALRRLAEVSMLQQRLPDRFELHDLLRQYARDKAVRLPGGQAAIERLVAHYVLTAERAREHLSGTPHRMPVAPAVPEVPVVEFTDHHAAVAWFDREIDTIARLVLGVDEHGLHVQAAVLFQLSWQYLYLRGHWRRMVAMGETAIRGAASVGDRFLQAKCFNGVSTGYGRVFERDKQIDYCYAALAVFRELGDRAEQGTSLLNLGSALNWQRRFAEAVEPLREAVRLYESAGDHLSAAMALNNLADTFVGLDRFEEARGPARQALDTFRKGKEPARIVAGLETIAAVQAGSGDHHAAAATYREAVDLVEEVHVTRSAVPLRVKLGHALLALGDVDQAHRVWREAYDRCLREGDQIAADEIRALLTAPHG